jgi:hypothetical protein
LGQAGCLEHGWLRTHIRRVAEGWNLITLRLNPRGGANLKGHVVVRVADDRTAVAIVQRTMPDAVISVDCEASLEALDQYDVKPGEALVLWESGVI